MHEAAVTVQHTSGRQRDRPAMDPDSTLAVEASGLVKAFGTTRAVDGVDLAVPAGSVYGVLGPNGAGKTTTIRMLATLLRPDGGRARVLGHDVVAEADTVRGRVSLTGQYASVDDDLTGRENLVLLARLLGYPRPQAKARASELLAAFGLAEAAGRQVHTYSGGMRRRLDIAASIVVTPDLLFLDEPTAGLDPRSRTQVWDIVRTVVADGTTVLLTTQYLDEADQLADRIAVVDHGRVIADGTPGQLKSRIGGDQIDVVVRGADELTAAAGIVGRVAGAAVEVDADTRRISAPVHQRVATLTEVVRALDDAGVAAEDIALRRPTLDEVFLRLTGHHADQEVAA
jgi:ABC-2 type transport system ATP-binding protein